MSPLRIKPVETPKELRAFIHLPYRLHKRHPAFVPPLISEVKDTLDRTKNPFFKHADMELFLAYRDSRVVGRIAAIEDSNFIQARQEMVGLFGFFDCIDDITVSRALFNSASQWLRKKHLRKMLGPANPSMNDEIGVLMNAFDIPPAIKMVWNPSYYPILYEENLFEKAKDIYAWEMNKEDVSQRILQFGETVLKRLKIQIRPVNLKRFKEEVMELRKIYNQAWSQNWGFVPWSEEEFLYAAKNLKKIVDPDLVLVAEDNGRPVGFSLALPDLNEALRHINGRLFPFGLPFLLWYSRKIRSLRVLILGIIKEFRGRGIDSA
ncbi:MAG: N-acetyltransferase, partial [bacterium]